MGKKRGRPKQAPRPKIDLGTPETIMRRMAISPQDQTLATCPLDALKSRGFISDDAFAAAEHFRACHRTKFGSPHPKAVAILQPSEGGMYQGDTEKAELGYRQAADALRAVSRQHFDAMENIIIHERWPEWFYKPSQVDRNQNRAMEAFAVLVKWDRTKPKVVHKEAAE